MFFLVKLTLLHSDLFPNEIKRKYQPPYDMKTRQHHPSKYSDLVMKFGKARLLHPVLVSAVTKISHHKT